MTGECPGAGLQTSRSVRSLKRRVRDEYPIVAQTRTAAVGTIPVDDRTCGHRGTQVHLPPGIRIESGRGHRAVEKASVRIAIHRRAAGGVPKRVLLWVAVRPSAKSPPGAPLST